MSGKEDIEKVKNEIPLIIPSDSPKIHASGAFGGYTPHEFRIFLYSETPTPVDQLFESEQLKVIREVQSELILSPLAAKELVNWLSEKINDFEKDFGVIPSPANNSHSNK